MRPAWTLRKTIPNQEFRIKQIFFFFTITSVFLRINWCKNMVKKCFQKIMQRIRINAIAAIAYENQLLKQASQSSSNNQVLSRMSKLSTNGIWCFFPSPNFEIQLCFPPFYKHFWIPLLNYDLQHRI